MIASFRILNDNFLWPYVCCDLTPNRKKINFFNFDGTALKNIPRNIPKKCDLFQQRNFAIAPFIMYDNLIRIISQNFNY